MPVIGKDRQPRHYEILNSIDQLRKTKEKVIGLRDEISGAQTPCNATGAEVAGMPSLNSFLSDTHITISQLCDDINGAIGEIRDMLF